MLRLNYLTVNFYSTVMFIVIFSVNIMLPCSLNFYIPT